MADAKSTTPAAVKLAWPDLALVALSALMPMVISALGAIPNPAVSVAAMVLAAVWTLAKSWIATKHLGSRADVEKAVAGVMAAIEKASGKDIPADIESAVQFGAGAAAESAGLTVPAPAATAK